MCAGSSLPVESASSSPAAELSFSPRRLLPLQTSGSGAWAQRMWRLGLTAPGHVGYSRSREGLSLCLLSLLHWQADCLPQSHQGSHSHLGIHPVSNCSDFEVILNDFYIYYNPEACEYVLNSQLSGCAELARLSSLSPVVQEFKQPSSLGTISVTALVFCLLLIWFNLHVAIRVIFYCYK